MMRLFFSITALLSALFLPWWIFVLIAFLYSLFYTPYEIIFIGLFIDASFGEVGRSLWYSYTVVGAGAIILSRLIRPLLMFSG